MWGDFQYDLNNINSVKYLPDTRFIYNLNKKLEMCPPRKTLVSYA